jgi:cytochrome c553
MIFLSHLRAATAIGAVALIALGLSSTFSFAGDVAKGRQIASAKCQVCHGLDGQSKMPQAPNLAGQVEQYLAEQITAFKTGVRKNELMTIVVKTLSASDIADLAAYYAAIEVKVGKVPGQ